MLLNTGGDGEDIGVEDDVFRQELDLLREQIVGAFADLGLARIGIGLSFFVKGHHDDCCAITLAQRGLPQKLRLAFLHADGVDDGLALYTLQPGLDHFPLGGIDHDRHARDVRLRCQQIQKARHGRLGIEHRLIHIDVDHLRAVFHLLARHHQRLIVLAIQNHARKRTRAGDIGALADVDEQRLFVDVGGFKP